MTAWKPGTYVCGVLQPLTCMSSLNSVEGLGLVLGMQCKQSLLMPLAAVVLPAEVNAPK
jgi:hydrogenase/urease accessory protein HupE